MGYELSAPVAVIRHLTVTFVRKNHLLAYPLHVSEGGQHAKNCIKRVFHLDFRSLVQHPCCFILLTVSHHLSSVRVLKLRKSGPRLCFITEKVVASNDSITFPLRMIAVSAIINLLSHRGGGGQM